MAHPRILFYAVNGLGLGHVTRLLAIARKVRERAPGAEILFLTSSEAEDVIYREGFAAFKVPSRSLRADAGLRPSTYARIFQTVVVNLLSSFHSHILVVDTFPAGSMQELLPVLRWDSRRVFVYREQRPEAARSPLMQNTLHLYDLAIIPHREGEVDAPLPEGIEREWVGPIVVRDRTETVPRTEARDRLGLPEDGRIVYVSFGGGGDRDGASAMLRVVDALADVPGVHLAIPAAPLYRGQLPRRQGVTIVWHYPMAEMLTAYDAAVSACGYNSAMELAHHGVPTAFVPFRRQVDDQEKRAREIEEAGAGIALLSLEPETVCNAVTRLLDATNATEIAERARALVPDSGADRAAAAILGLLR